MTFPFFTYRDLIEMSLTDLLIWNCEAILENDRQQTAIAEAKQK